MDGQMIVTTKWRFHSFTLFLSLSFHLPPRLSISYSQLHDPITRTHTTSTMKRIRIFARYEKKQKAEVEGDRLLKFLLVHNGTSNIFLKREIMFIIVNNVVCAMNAAMNICILRRIVSLSCMPFDSCTLSNSKLFEFVSRFVSTVVAHFFMFSVRQSPLLMCVCAQAACALMCICMCVREREGVSVYFIVVD